MLICIQIKALALGATLVVSFSIGLALTLVTVGVGLQSASVRSPDAGTVFILLPAEPLFSSLLIAVMGLYLAIHSGFVLLS